MSCVRDHHPVLCCEVSHSAGRTSAPAERHSDSSASPGWRGARSDKENLGCVCTAAGFLQKELKFRVGSVGNGHVHP